MLDPNKVKEDFPIFQHDPALIYLDNAATMQKPARVINGITQFYQQENANIHRGIYPLAVQATQRYEAVREKVAQYIGAAQQESIVYTSGTTAGINLVAQSFLAARLEEGDNVIISAMEHHANLIPWQMVCKHKKAELIIIPIDKAGNLDIQFLKDKLTSKTKMVALCHISNTLGTINPIESIISICKQQEIPVLIDAAQSVAHYPIQVEQLGIDFMVFSAHKLYGPTGVGILYGKKKWLEQMPPIYFGGDMIRSVTYTDSTFAPPPQRFEAGTTNIAGVVGLGYAIDYVNQLDKKEVAAHLKDLSDYAHQQLQKVEGLEIIGQAANKSAIASFTLKNIHPHDIATFLGASNIAIRAGHHCTQPLMDYYGLPATTRASFSIYNQKQEVDKMVNVLEEMNAFFN